MGELPPIRYDDEAVAAIARSVGVGPDAVRPYVARLTEAARWFHMMDTAAHIPPYQVLERLEVARNHLAKARRALFGDGPDDTDPDPEIEDALERGDIAGAPIADASTTLAALVARLDRSIAATRALPAAPRRNRTAADTRTEDWVADVLDVYSDLTGKEPGVSIDAVSGEVRGPLVRFLDACAAPVGLSAGPNRWRYFVRLLVETARGNGGDSAI